MKKNCGCEFVSCFWLPKCPSKQLLNRLITDYKGTLPWNKKQ